VLEHEGQQRRWRKSDVSSAGWSTRKLADPTCYARFARCARGASEGGPAAPLRTPRRVPLRRVRIDATVHGFCSSFRSWCSDEGIDRELADQTLAYAVGSQVEQCYARSDVLERRREVMEEWRAFLGG